MTRYVCLLRGINVSGKNLLAMGRLQEMFESLKLQEVTTYIQSGNIVFTAPASRSPNKLTKDIAALLVQETGNAISTFLYSAADFAQISRSNPFLKEKGIDQKKLHVVFLDSTPTREGLKQLGPGQDGDDRFVPASSVIYLHCPVSYGKTKFSNQYFEKKLGVSATTRNWNTVSKLLDLSG